MKPITLGINIERIFATVLVTRDELEKLKDRIKDLAHNNIIEIDEILIEIENVHKTIESEYYRFNQLWKKAIVEYNSFMDDSEWEKTILPYLNKIFSDKLNSFLDQFSTLVQICKDFFDNFLEDKYFDSTTKYKLDRNPYYELRDDISEKSELVRKSFVLPDSIGYNWYSSKISDEYLKIKNSLIGIIRYDESEPYQVIDSYLKGNAIHETLIFHPKYGSLNYISAGIERNFNGLSDYETGDRFLKVIMKNMDEWKGQYNEYKNRKFYDSSAAYEPKGSKDIPKEKQYLPEYLGILRNRIETGNEADPGDSYLIIKMRDNKPLLNNKPKTYQVVRMNTDLENISKDYSYDNLPNEPKETIKILTPYYKNDPNDTKTYYTNFSIESKEIIKEMHRDNNTILSKHFPVETIDIKESISSSTFLNFSSRGVISAGIFNIGSSKADGSIFKIMSSPNRRKIYNISYYKTEYMKKIRNDYDLFKNYVIKVFGTLTMNGRIFLPNNPYYKNKIIAGSNSRDDYLHTESYGILQGNYISSLVKDYLFDNFSVRVSVRNSYKGENITDSLIESAMKDIVNDGHSLIWRGNPQFSILDKIDSTNMKEYNTYYQNVYYTKFLTFNLLEYFDLFNNPNEFNNYFAFPSSDNNEYVMKRETFEKKSSIIDHLNPDRHKYSFEEQVISSYIYRELNNEEIKSNLTLSIEKIIISGPSYIGKPFEGNRDYFDKNLYRIFKTTKDLSTGSSSHGNPEVVDNNLFKTTIESNYTENKEIIFYIFKIEDIIVKEDTMTTNASSRSLLNNTSLTKDDIDDVVESFYYNLEEKLAKYSSLLIGTIKFIPYSIENPVFLGNYVKAGTILNKSDYPEAYSLFGDKYAEQYDTPMEEGKFALPNLYGRYLQFECDPEKTNKFYDDSIPDLGYTFEFSDREITEDNDKREGFLAENSDKDTSLLLAMGKSGGVDRKKIKVRYNSSASITSGADFKLDYYIRVK